MGRWRGLHRLPRSFLVIAILTVDANLPFCHQLRRRTEVEPRFFWSMPIYLSFLFASSFSFSIELREICIVLTLIASKLHKCLFRIVASVRCISGERSLIGQPTYSFVVHRFDDVFYFKFRTDVAITKNVALLRESSWFPSCIKPTIVPGSRKSPIF